MAGLLDGILGSKAYRGVNKGISGLMSPFIDNPYEDPFMRSVWDDIKGDEGYRALPYLDSKKNITMAIGHLGADNGMLDSAFTTPNEAEELFEKDLGIRVEEVSNILTPSVYSNLSEEAKRAVINMHFRGDLQGSPVTRSLIMQGRMDDAAKEFLNHDEYREAVKNKKLHGIDSGLIDRFEKNARRLRS
tara:strand:+ start:413 stop:979 length:567 start_codon:yes stop_codon:yes gene_type:complete